MSVNATRSLAAWSLSQIAPGDPGVAKTVIPQLVKDLQSNRGGGRREAAQALEKFGAAAEEAVSSLKYAADDPDPAVRSAAKKALQAIEGR
jgi:HEAT repeat protein